MAETLDELTYDYEEDGVLVRKQLERAVLSQGGWPTVMFLYQELDRKSGQFRAPKMAIVRFKKSRGLYRKQSSFNITSEKQARQIAAVFDGWYPRMTGSRDDETAEGSDGRTGDGDGEGEGGWEGAADAEDSDLGR